VLSRNARLILQRADEFAAGTRRPSPVAVEFYRRVRERAAAIEADRDLRLASRTRATVCEIARLAGATLR
jgi:uncharacterized protein YbjT (DUF2867 family)